VARLHLALAPPDRNGSGAGVRCRAIDEAEVVRGECGARSWAVGDDTDGKEVRVELTCHLATGYNPPHEDAFSQWGEDGKKLIFNTFKWTDDDPASH